METFNFIVPTRPSGDSTKAAASTEFVTSAIGNINTGLSVGTTTVTGGVSGRFLFDNGGLLGERSLFTTGALVTSLIYSSSQTVTIPASATQAFVRMGGATGGGGGGQNTPNPIGGVGAGGYLEKYLTGLTAGSTLVYTQGAAGTAGTAGGLGAGGTGGTGGTTTLASGTQTISTLTCNGSPGSDGNGNGSVGGTASGGDVNIKGQSGVNAAASGTAPGGRNFFSVGIDGYTPSGNVAGNPGNPGLLVIMWYT